jgi:beta-glucosidase
VKELKGFAKIDLQAGEETTVSMELDSRAFAFFDPKSNGWIVEPGEFEILAGASSRDIRLSGILNLE